MRGASIARATCKGTWGGGSRWCEPRGGRRRHQLHRRGTIGTMRDEHKRARVMQAWSGRPRAVRRAIIGGSPADSKDRRVGSKDVRLRRAHLVPRRRAAMWQAAHREGARAPLESRARGERMGSSLVGHQSALLVDLPTNAQGSSALSR